VAGRWSFVRHRPSSVGGVAPPNMRLQPDKAAGALAAARIDLWPWRTLYRRNPIPRSHHAREERSLRTPFNPGPSRGPRPAGGSLAGHRYRAWYLVLVRADGVRGKGREASGGEDDLRT